MRAGLVVSVVTAGLLTVALPAVAKGPVSASIEGPGLAGPLVVEWSDGNERLAGLLTHSRLSDVLSAATGAIPPGVTVVTPSPSPPTRRLGSRYLVTYDLGTPGDVVRQDLYPYAAGGPVVHLPAGQRFGTWPLRGGWLRADAALLDLLTDVGLPAVDPAPPAARAPTPGPSSPISGQPEGTAGGSWPVRNAEWLLAGLVALCLPAAVWMTRAAHRRHRTAESVPGLRKVH